MKIHALTTAALTLFAQPSFADITVRFIESAPKDRFVISSDTCPLNNVDMLIDLSGSAGGLIFDVTAAGAGVEVFQPVLAQQGDATIATVSDGDQQLSFMIHDLQADEDIIVSAELDDVLPNSSLGQIRVADAELDGATVQITIAGMRETAAFQDGADTVTLPHRCLS